MTCDSNIPTVIAMDQSNFVAAEPSTMPGFAVGTNNKDNKRPLLKLPHRRRRRRSSGSVRFPDNPASVVGTVSTASSLSPEERKSVWYDSREVASFKAAIRAASAKIRMSPRQRAEDERTAGNCQKQVQLLRQYRSKDERELRANQSALDIARNAAAASANAAESGGESATTVDALLDGFGDNSGAGVIDEPRGLEQRTSFERQRNKFVAIRSVLAWQRRLKQRRAEAKAFSASANTAETAIDVDDDDDGAGEDTSEQLAEITSRVSRYARQVATETGKADFYRAYPDLTNQQQKQPSTPTAATLAAQHSNLREQFRRRSSGTKRKSIGEDSVPSIESEGSDEHNNNNNNNNNREVEDGSGAMGGTDGSGSSSSPRNDGMHRRPSKRRSITQDLRVGLSSIALEAAAESDVEEEEED